ncbi:MAG TPA: hypothetical protein V6C72_12400, partial [Chroococcales cyanobacterium]
LPVGESVPLAGGETEPPDWPASSDCVFDAAGLDDDSGLDGAAGFELAAGLDGASGFELAAGLDGAAGFEVAAGIDDASGFEVAAGLDDAAGAAAESSVFAGSASLVSAFCSVSAGAFVSLIGRFGSISLRSRW